MFPIASLLGDVTVRLPHGFDGNTTVDLVQLRPHRTRNSTAHRRARPDYRDHLRNRAFFDRKAALVQLLRGIKAGILLNEHVAEDGPTVFAHACRLGAEGIVSKRVDGTYRSRPCPVCAAGAQRELEQMI